jgi:hypothetical protein
VTFDDDAVRGELRGWVTARIDALVARPKPLENPFETAIGKLGPGTSSVVVFDASGKPFARIRDGVPSLRFLWLLREARVGGESLVAINARRKADEADPVAALARFRFETRAGIDGGAPEVLTKAPASRFSGEDRAWHALASAGAETDAARVSAFQNLVREHAGTRAAHEGYVPYVVTLLGAKDEAGARAATEAAKRVVTDPAILHDLDEVHRLHDERALFAAIDARVKAAVDALDPSGLLAVARDALRDGKPVDVGIRAAEMSLILRPDDPATRFVYAKLLVLDERYGPAVREAERALASKPSASLRGEIEEAAVRWKAALDLLGPPK